MPLILSLLLGGLCATVVGVLFGIPSLRIKGLYLAVATLAAQFFVDWAVPAHQVVHQRLVLGLGLSVADLQIVRLADRDAGAASTCSAWRSLVRVRAAGARTWCAARIGREWMAMRDMDVAAAVIGIRPVYAKLTAFAVSSLHRRRGRRAVGLRPPGLLGAGGLLDRPLVPAAVHGDHRRPRLDHGQLLRRGLHRVLPIVLNQLPALARHARSSTATASHLEFMIFGALIVFFLIVEPHGLARLWATGKEKLRLWPFPH